MRALLALLNICGYFSSICRQNQGPFRANPAAFIAEPPGAPFMLIEPFGFRYDPGRGEEAPLDVLATAPGTSNVAASTPIVTPRKTLSPVLNGRLRSAPASERPS